VNVPELPLRTETPVLDPLNDFAMIDAAMAAAAVKPTNDPPQELPLFGPPPLGDQPLITKPSPPRQPLAVRRATPEVPRPRSPSLRTPMFDLTDSDTSDPNRTRAGAHSTHATTAPDFSEAPAPLGARLGAAAMDLALLAIIDAIVIYLTMQICGITFEDLEILPKAPLVAFLLLQNGGYLVAFTAGGQTLGKLAAGIRVVPARADRSLDFSHSLLRTVVWLPLALPAGLGLLTALLSPDRRGLHDRCAGTKVVRASA
jgi:uncharacterized RDD family membrane protein YckC